MSALYRVRFAPSIKFDCPAAGPAAPRVAGRSKSRSGCRECKSRHVKCDERYPVCLRCERRGSVCLPASRPDKWRTEVPWLVHGPFNTFQALPHTNKRLLHYWLEKSSHIMALDPNRNPFSFPVLEHLAAAPSLLHALQSVSAGYEQFYDPANLQICLQERGRALMHMYDELQGQKPPLPVLFLTIFLLGVSSAWIGEHPLAFGKEHLLGARTVMDLIIASKDWSKDHLARFAVGSYMYWDMSCSFLFSSDQLEPLNNPAVFNAVQELSNTFHPIAGYSVELFYLLGSLGRYCRAVLETAQQDVILEETFQEQIQSWQPMRDDIELGLLSESYKYHGLIMLYRICGRRRHFNNTAPKNTASDDLETELLFSLETEDLITDYATHIIRNLSQTSVSSSYFNLQLIPLFTAGSELTYLYPELRIEVVGRFKALYSTNRAPVNLLAVQLLTELWEIRDGGVVVSFLEFLMQKGVNLSFA